MCTRERTHIRASRSHSADPNTQQPADASTPQTYNPTDTSHPYPSAEKFQTPSFCIGKWPPLRIREFNPSMTLERRHSFFMGAAGDMLVTRKSKLARTWSK